MAVVNSDSITYQSQKAIMLTFNLISEQKAKNRLLYMHSQILYRFMAQLNKRLQQVYHKQSE